LADETGLDAIAPSININTDDNALIEFGAPRDLVAFAEDDPEVAVLKLNPDQRIALWLHAFPPSTAPPRTTC